MNTIRYPIAISEGADFSKVFKLLDLNKVALDLTGCTFVGALLTEQGGVSIGSLTFDLNQLNLGIVVFSISKSVTSLCTSDKAWYYVEITWPDTKVERLIQGNVTVNLK